MAPTATVRGITLDVSDLDRGVEFWGALLGIGVTDRQDTYVWFDQVSPGVRLILQEVRDPHGVKNRMHLDLHADDPDAFIDHVMDLGGSRLDTVDDPAYALTVMADPDGNEFCVARRLSAALSDSPALP